MKNEQGDTNSQDLEQGGDNESIEDLESKNIENIINEDGEEDEINYFTEEETEEAEENTLGDEDRISEEDRVSVINETFGTNYRTLDEAKNARKRLNRLKKEGTSKVTKSDKKIGKEIKKGGYDQDKIKSLEDSIFNLEHKDLGAETLRIIEEESLKLGIPKKELVKSEILMAGIKNISEEESNAKKINEPTNSYQSVERKRESIPIEEFPFPVANL